MDQAIANSLNDMVDPLMDNSRAVSMQDYESEEQRLLQMAIQ